MQVRRLTGVISVSTRPYTKESRLSLEARGLLISLISGDHSRLPNKILNELIKEKYITVQNNEYIINDTGQISLSLMNPKPSLEEVMEYAKERGYGEPARKYYLWFSSKGWKKGGEPIEDWKAGLDYWMSKEIVVAPKKDLQEAWINN